MGKCLYKLEERSCYYRSMSRSKRDEGNLVTRGIAEVMEAYNGALLADIFGDTPYSEASLLDENGSPVNMNPKIDKQEEIYVSIMAPWTRRSRI